MIVAWYNECIVTQTLIPTSKNLNKYHRLKRTLENIRNVYIFLDKQEMYIKIHM